MPDPSLTDKQARDAQRHLNELGMLLIEFLEADSEWEAIAHIPNAATTAAYERARAAKLALRRFVGMEA